MTKEKTGRQIIAATRRSINARIDAPKKARGGATKSALRATLDNYPPIWVDDALQLKGVGMKTANADDLYDVLYGIRWAMAYKRPLAEYFATAWGEETLPMRRNFNVYAHGEYWGTFIAEDEKEAIQIAADTFGTIDIGQKHASVDGMTAKPA
jgi:hypothetical protein